MSFLVCGLDEVGRGALAGPLFAVAAAFYSYSTSAYWEKKASPLAGIDDSKKLSAQRRREMFGKIIRYPHLSDFGIGHVAVDEIDHMGIEQANDLAFRRAVEDLRVSPDYVLVDGVSPLLGWDMQKQWHEPRADGLWWPVGAASILAKVIRDSLMAELGNQHPQYLWAKNAGYGTKDHTEALLEHGASPHHRKQFIKRIIGRSS